MNSTTLRTVFWVLLVAFMAWDWMASPPVDLRWEQAPIAAGSGQAMHGGHCSMPD